jgi:uncharacterized protein YcfJ
MYEAEITNRFKNPDPHKPPKQKNNDIYIPLFAIIGAFIGGWLGSFGNSFVFFISILAGAAIGAFAGNSIKNWRKNKTKANEKED